MYKCPVVIKILSQVTFIKKKAHSPDIVLYSKTEPLFCLRNCGCSFQKKDILIKICRETQTVD